MWDALGLIEWEARRHAGFLGDDKYEQRTSSLLRGSSSGEDIPSEEVRNDTADYPTVPARQEAQARAKGMEEELSLHPHKLT
jgi:hypothetical protein